MSARILIVEDDPSVRTLLDSLLSGEGYDVRTASDGTGALQLAQQDTPAVILLDVMMPDLGGVHVLDQLCKHDSLGSVPVVVVTGKVEMLGDLRDRVGHDRVFLKPFVVADLLDRVASLAGGSHNDSGVN